MDISLPDIWGQGALFAFSGLDGACTVAHGMQAYLLGDLLGVRVCGAEMFDLYVSLGEIKDIRYEIVASDLISGCLRDRSGQETQVILTFLDENTIVGVCGRGRLRVHALDEICPEKTDGMVYYRGKDTVYTLFSEDTEQETVFAFSGHANPSVSMQTVLGLKEKRLALYRTYAKYAPVRSDVQRTFLKCMSVMRSQVYTREGRFHQRWTTPDRLPHRWLWLWDSVFHSMGNHVLSPGLAQETLLSVLDAQQPDGMIPHMARPDYVSGITQPPVLAWGVLREYERTGDRAFLEACMPGLERYLQWNMRNRMDPETGLFFWDVNPDQPTNRCDESGMDNSPRFDHARKMGCVDFCSYMLHEARCMARICEILHTDGTAWHALRDRLISAMRTWLWHEEDGVYYDRVLGTMEWNRVLSVVSFLPLFAGACDARESERLVRYLRSPEHFGTCLPLPSISRSDPVYGSDMWRGPVWINFSYMIAQGLKDYGFSELAEDVIRKTVLEIARWYHTDGVVYEMYDPEGRMSPHSLPRKGQIREPYAFSVRYQAIRDYGWSATLCAAMIMENPGLFV